MPSTPKSSIPKTKEAIGVLVAPANTPTSPKEAKNEGDKFNIPDNVFPKVDPITNKGVTSPLDNQLLKLLM